MWAAKFGDLKMVELLVNSEHSIQNSNGETALMIASRFRNKSVALTLAKYEAGKQDKLKWTALMWTAVMGLTDVARVLLDAEAGLQDKDGQTALMLSVEKGNYDVSMLLLQRESKIQMNNGMTALMKATLTGNAKIVSLLVHYELGLKDSTGKTALMHAAQRGSVWLFDSLAEEASMIDNDRKTAFVLAREAGLEHHNLIHLLLTRRYLCDQRRNSWFFIYCMDQELEYLRLMFSETSTIQSLGWFREAMFSLLFDDLDITTETLVAEKVSDCLASIKEMEDDVDTQPCSICLDYICEVVFLPCRHCIACCNCTEVLKKRCPYCRLTVDNMVLVDYNFDRWAPSMAT